MATGDNALAYAVVAIADVEYGIGAADLTVATPANQITQPGGDATAFCLTDRITSAISYNPSGHSSKYSTSDGNLIYTSNPSATADEETTITIQYKLDGVDIAGKTVSFKVTAKDVCSAVTFTKAADQASVPIMYAGRDASLTWPAWTPSPSHCPFVYYIADLTSSGPLGDASSLVTATVASDTRTVAILASQVASWTEALRKTYTLPIQVKHPNDAGTLVDSLTYNYQFTVTADPCSTSSPTETLLEASRTATISHTLLQAEDKEYLIDMNWSPSACDDTHKHFAAWGTMGRDDVTNMLADDGYLSIATNDRLVLKANTPSSKAGTYTIYITAKT